jgi:hypothetical protein
MKSLTLKLQSRTQMLMHKLSFTKVDTIKFGDVEALADVPRVKAIAEAGAYRNKSGQLIIPANNLYRGFIAAGGCIVKKGATKYTKDVAGAVCVLQDMVLTNAEGVPLTEYEVDIQRGIAKNGANTTSVNCIRPRIDEWYGSLTFEFDEEVISEPKILEIVKAYGSKIGFLDFRPERKGPYGQFNVLGAAKAVGV